MTSKAEIKRRKRRGSWFEGTALWMVVRFPVNNRVHGYIHNVQELNWY